MPEHLILLQFQIWWRKVSFLIKGSTLLSRDRRERENKEKAREILDKTSFCPKPGRVNNTFQELVDILDKNLEHKKTTHLYVETTLQDPITIETETQAIMRLIKLQPKRKNKVMRLSSLTTF